jgi:glutamyl-tRNA synthetase
MPEIRTRFAPSPTGHVHIGNMRAAIYNWLFARHSGGKFLLRMEDTDRERSTAEACRTVLEAMDWLGLDIDEEPLYQSTRMPAHLAAAEQMLAQGQAYREDKGGKGECIVFRMPGEDMSFADEIKGELKKKAADMQDFVIVRSNGTPVFHLANVLDDIEMGVTHIIRGDDHIENTYRHIALYRALGATPPRYAHLPMIVNQQGKPYSKRDGDAFVGDFHEQGYLPEALFNYLALLGWSPGDDREIMSRGEMVAAFELQRVQSSPARMDAKKLLWMNGQYMQMLPRATRAAQARELLQSAGLWDEKFAGEYFERVLDTMAERIKLKRDIVDMAAFFFTENYEYDPKAVAKRLEKEGALENIAALRARFAELESFDAQTLEAALNSLAEERGIGAGALIHPCRVAVSGLMAGPGLYEMLEILGRERVLERIERTLARFPHQE